MADVRHRFVPTEQRPAVGRAQQTRRTARPLRAAVAWALVLGAAALLSRPLLKSAGPDDPHFRFTTRRAQFQLLKDMLLAETTVTSVGPDNVREYWLFDGHWSSPRRPGQFLSRGEMLEEVGLTSDRYAAYLDLLRIVGGYRAARSGGGKNARVVVQLLPTGRAPGARAVYDPAPGGKGAPDAALGDGWALEPSRG